MIEIIQDKVVLSRIGAEWNALASRSEFPLLRHEWFLSCAEAFSEEKKLRIVLVRSQGNIVAIAPLAIIRKKGIEYLELLGSSFLDEPCDLLYDNYQSLKLLLNAILKLKRPFYFHKIPYNSLVVKALSNLSIFKGLLIKRVASSTAYVPINSSWSEHYNSLSSKRRYDLRRARRRAEEFGNVSYRILCPQLDELEMYLKVAFEIEAAGWKGRRGSALLINERLKKFFQVYSALACKKGILRLCFLFINEKAVAMLIGVEYLNRFWVLKIGFNEKWSRCSPGIQLINETIRYAFNNNLKSYEFLGSDEPWLHMWAKTNLRQHSSIGFYTTNIHGIAALSNDIIKFSSKKIINKFQTKV